jgi:hypothetical protein
MWRDTVATVQPFSSPNQASPRDPSRRHLRTRSSSCTYAHCPLAQAQTACSDKVRRA